MKQIFDKISNDKILHRKSHLSAISFERSNCHPANDRKFYVIPVTNDWIHITFVQIHINLEHCKLHFLGHNTTRESCIKVTICVCGWCQAISSIKMSNTSVSIVPSIYSIFLPVVCLGNRKTVCNALCKSYFISHAIKYMLYLGEQANLVEG